MGAWNMTKYKTTHLRMWPVRVACVIQARKMQKEDRFLGTKASIQDIIRRSIVEQGTQGLEDPFVKPRGI